MRNRDESRRQGYESRGGYGGYEDQRREREEQGDWRQGSGYMRGSDRGYDRGGGWRPEDRGGWRPEDRGRERWEGGGYRGSTGYGGRGEGYQGGYNVGMNYGQGGPQGQGFGQGGHGRGYDDRGELGGSYGGFGGHGYRTGEGSWRQGRWESEGQGGGSSSWSPGQGHGQPRQAYGPYDEDRQQNFRQGFGMSPSGGYGSREQGAYAGDEDRGTWGSGVGGHPGGGYQGGGGYQRQGRPPKGYQRSDERIREDICDRVIGMGIDAGDVDIKVQSCEVTLTGSVDSRHDKRRLEDLAESVSGVKNVHNQLRVNDQQQSGQQSRSTGYHQEVGSGGQGTVPNATGGKSANQQNNRTQ